jgi:hypothetical protein
LGRFILFYVSAAPEPPFKEDIPGNGYEIFFF